VKKMRLLSEGRYSRVLASKQGLLDMFEAFLLDPDITDVRPELALQRTLLAAVLEDVAGSDGDVIYDQKSISAVHQLNKQVAELSDQVERSMARAPTTINAVQMLWFVEQLIRVVLVASREAFPGDQHAQQRSTLVELVADGLEAIVVPNDRGCASPPQYLANLLPGAAR